MSTKLRCSVCSHAARQHVHDEGVGTGGASELGHCIVRTCSCITYNDKSPGTIIIPGLILTVDNPTTETALQAADDTLVLTDTAVDKIEKTIEAIANMAAALSPDELPPEILDKQVELTTILSDSAVVEIVVDEAVVDESN